MRRRFLRSAPAYSKACQTCTTPETSVAMIMSPISTSSSLSAILQPTSQAVRRRRIDTLASLRLGQLVQQFRQDEVRPQLGQHRIAVVPFRHSAPIASDADFLVAVYLQATCARSVRHGFAPMPPLVKHGHRWPLSGFSAVAVVASRLRPSAGKISLPRLALDSRTFFGLCFDDAHRGRKSNVNATT